MSKDEFPKKFRLISYYKETWDTSKKILLQLKKMIISKLSKDNNINNFDPFDLLSSVIQIFENKNRFNQFDAKDIIESQSKKCIALNIAIKTHFKNNINFFYLEILPFIIDQALLLDERANQFCGEQVLPLIFTHTEYKISFPRKLILSILSNNFFCNHKDFISQLNINQKQMTHLEEWSNVDWYWLYTTDSNVSIQRIICFISYFEELYKIFKKCEKNVFLPGNITIEKILINSEKIINNLQNNNEKFEEKDIYIHESSMENPNIDYETQGFVDFANRDLQTGQIIPSATQEEILFSIRPEMYIAMFICQRIGNNEILIISGAPKLFDYKGYGSNFEYICPKQNIFNLLTEEITVKNENHPHILVLDATMKEHYSFNSVIQDISKFYTACNFMKNLYDKPGISTGSWGCGAFGCDRAHKFLQQLLVSKANGVKLAYSSNGKKKYAENLKELMKMVVKNTPSVKDLWEFIIGFKGMKNEEFHKYLKEKLGDEFYVEK